MSQDKFGVRYGFEEPADILPIDELPGPAREDFFLEVKHFIDSTPPSIRHGLQYEIYEEMRPMIWKVREKNPPRNPQGDPFSYYVPEVIRLCQWYEFYEICELVYRVFTGRHRREYGDKVALKFSSSANAQFRRYGLAWQYDNKGEIIRVHPKLVENMIATARACLISNSKYKGPDEQFSKAIGHLNARPNPDYENAVKDAIGAVEGLARILMSSNATLSEILKTPLVKNSMHQTLGESLGKIYAYRGDEGGVAHGLVGPSKVGKEEADLILTLTAGYIVYLATKLPTPGK